MSPLTAQQLIDIAYIVAVALFILALKWLSSPASARRGVLAGEIGQSWRWSRRSATMKLSSTNGSRWLWWLGQ